MSELIFFDLAVLIIIFFVGIGLLDKFSIQKSKLYRQDLSNMYVAGKIKQIAKKDGIDLDKEFLEFAKVTKNKKIDYEALDSTIERKLQEKISETESTEKDKAAVPDKE